MADYSQRVSLLESGEQSWTITAEALVRAAPSGETRQLVWRDVTQVRLAFSPTRFKTNRHVLTLTTRDGQRWRIDNMHFAGIGRFEDRSARFTPFVLACVERIAAQAPGAAARLGAAAAVYWSQLAFVVAAFGLLAAILLILPVGAGVVVWVKLVVILAALPLLARWILRARPRRTQLAPDAFRAVLP